MHVEAELHKQMGVTPSMLPSIPPWDNERFELSMPFTKEAEARWRNVMIVGAIALLSLAHWLAPHSESAQNVLHHLDVIPILFAGMLFGWRSSVWATAITAA